MNYSLFGCAWGKDTNSKLKDFCLLIFSTYEISVHQTLQINNN